MTSLDMLSATGSELTAEQLSDVDGGLLYVFGAGILVGLGVGIAIGVAIAVM